ncbi:5-bromo-4-chloroindolyl phosphate hydrolysis family protein [Anaeromicropila populeti]|uniref:5-bromo-4-chloroindolyl phosphate hydrolysis protein n=1 Tax=Anaeromicropila populeti TaxID=37658 RepID=A0A1I6INH3_9FIRM|nr:5-bromo-4-chloroindolyl phosphate hydrolysis family protein [Anaeromicropila populeti]SFR68274.1 5-bromo-4-chloroindolyl phosphate hydrolysis protein [Anaeromicropila populeti]
MSKRNNLNIGDEIKDIVQNAVNTMDFHQLNSDIGNTVNGALEEVRNSLGIYTINKRNRNTAYNKYTQSNEHQNGDEFKNNNEGSTKQVNCPQNNTQHYTTTRNNPKATYPSTQKHYNNIPNFPIGRVSGKILTVLGNMGFGLVGIAIFVLYLVGASTGNLYVLGTIAFGLSPLLFIFLYMAVKGSQIRKRLRRFRRYLRTFQGRSYYSIKELSHNCGLSKKFILKDFRKMVSLGMFPEGHIDDEETCLILNRESYNQYRALQKNMIMQKEQAKSKDDYGQETNHISDLKQSVNQTTRSELEDAIENGQTCIRQIKEANDAIQSEDMSRKLYRLEEVIAKIFNYVESHPAQLAEIQKFMDYYLPTTLKLVNAYKDFDRQSVQGETITTAKNEIENTLDTINQAFEKLFDSLFVDAAMDVSTDISVLETLLAQEGLTQGDFESNYGRTK